MTTSGEIFWAFNLLAPTGVSWLLTYAVHSTLLLTLVALLTRRLIQSHAARDILWKTALVGGVITATVQVGIGIEPMGGRFGLVAATEQRTRGSVLSSSADGIGRAHDLPPATEPAPDAAPLLLSVRPDGVPIASDIEARSNPEVDRTISLVGPSAELSWSAFLFSVWAVVAGLLLLYLIAGRMRMSYRLGRRRPVTEMPLRPLLEALCRAGRVRRPIRLTSAEGLSSPAAFGLSEICVPEAALTDLDREQQRSMLAHELAHLARLDPIWLNVACLLEQVLFFQPLNRLARRRMQDAAEYLCDDWAVRFTGSGITLAKCLVKVAEWLDASPKTVPVAGMAERRSQLVSRVHRLVENRAMLTQARRPWLMPFAAVLLVATAATAPGVTTAQQDAKAQQDSKDDLPGEVKVQVKPRPVPEVRVKPRIDKQVDKAWLKKEWRWKSERSQDTSNAAVPALIEALRDDDVEVRRAATQSLDQLQDPRAVAALIAALKDSDAEVRKTAAWALGELGDRRAVEPLIGALKDENAEVRQSAAHSLGELSDPRAAGALLEMLKDSSADVRHQSLWALNEIPDPRAVEPLINALKDSDADVRQMAAEGLGELADRRAVQPLMALLSDPSADVRHSAAHALAELHDPRAAEALAGALKDRDADVRQAAADALGELEITTAPQSLLDALKDDNAEVRRAAAETVGEMGDRRAVPALRGLLGDPVPEVRESALEALSEIRDAAAMEALIGALKSEDPNIRKQAAEELGQRE